MRLARVSTSFPLASARVRSNPARLKKESRSGLNFASRASISGATSSGDGRDRFDVRLAARPSCNGTNLEKHGEIKGTMPAEQWLIREGSWAQNVSKRAPAIPKPYATEGARKWRLFRNFFQSAVHLTTSRDTGRRIRGGTVGRKVVAEAMIVGRGGEPVFPATAVTKENLKTSAHTSIALKGIAT